MLTLILGSRPTVIELTIDHDPETNPEHIFKAANRIDEVDVDLAHLPTEWQRVIRRSIDSAGAPSMSVNDAVYVTSDSGEELGGWRCTSFGWVEAESTRRAAMLNGHLYHV
jgi:hypothetical protein